MATRMLPTVVIRSWSDPNDPNNVVQQDVYGPFGSANWQQEADEFIDAMEQAGLDGRYHVTTLEPPHLILVSAIKNHTLT